jgi:hypothetical protein
MSLLDDDSLMLPTNGSSSNPVPLNGSSTSSASFAQGSQSPRLYASSHQIINIDDKHPFDLELIVNQFKGRSKRHPSGDAAVADPSTLLS